MSPFGADPVKFLRHNLLSLSDFLDNPPAQSVRTDGTVLAKLVDVTGKYNKVIRARNRKGLSSIVPKSCQKWWVKPTHIYEVCPASQADADAFPAYVCPYVYTKACFKMLGNKASVMFTGNMDGCTFGVGMPNAEGGVRVGHANSGDKAVDLDDGGTDFAAQGNSQRAKLMKGATATRLVDPDAYRVRVVRGKTPRGYDNIMWCKAVTVGVLIGREWQFYYQRQVVDGKDLREGVELVRV